jgi:hypothetical protein
MLPLRTANDAPISFSMLYNGKHFDDFLRAVPHDASGSNRKSYGDGFRNPFKVRPLRLKAMCSPRRQTMLRRFFTTPRR